MRTIYTFRDKTAEATDNIINAVANDYEKQALRFLADTNTSMSIKFLSTSRHFPDDKVVRDRYKIRISNDQHTFKLAFGDSINNTNTKPRQAPTAYAILSCLHVWQGVTLTDFCDDFGYEEWDGLTGKTNKQTKKTYKAVLKESANLEKLFTEEQLEQLHEIQ